MQKYEKTGKDDDNSPFLTIFAVESRENRLHLRPLDVPKGVLSLHDETSILLNKYEYESPY